MNARYLSGVNQYGHHYLKISQENIFLTLKRQKDNRIGYQQKVE